MIRIKCLVCDSVDLNQIIDLGSHPFADTFVPESKISEPDLIYPLVCDLCSNCGHVQTRFVTNPIERYAQIDYSYTSANSAFSRKHWEDYAQEVGSKVSLKLGGLVVEVGSNDGFLSEQFIKNGAIAIGVDPSPYMVELAKQRQINTLLGLFETNIAMQIHSKYGNAELVVANNVFNHSDNPLDFVKAAVHILNKSGSFVFEQPYWIETIKSGKFDQIYHEHVSYFTVRSVTKLLSLVNMVVVSAQIVDYHGGSLRIIAQKKESGAKEGKEVQKMIREEIKYGAFEEETYIKFMAKNLSQRNRFLQKICEIKESGGSIVAVGAAAKGNTFLNFYRLDHSFVDYVTDASPYKKGKYTPATRIPIVGDEIFSNLGNVYALILSWNLANQLKEKLLSLNKNINFIIPENS